MCCPNCLEKMRLLSRVILAATQQCTCPNCGAVCVISIHQRKRIHGVKWRASILMLALLGMFLFDIINSVVFAYACLSLLFLLLVLDVLLGGFSRIEVADQVETRTGRWFHSRNFRVASLILALFFAALMMLRTFEHTSAGIALSILLPLLIAGLFFLGIK